MVRVGGTTTGTCTELWGRFSWSAITHGFRVATSVVQGLDGLDCSGDAAGTLLAGRVRMGVRVSLAVARNGSLGSIRRAVEGSQPQLSMGVFVLPPLLPLRLRGGCAAHSPPGDSVLPPQLRSCASRWFGQHIRCELYPGRDAATARECGAGGGDRREL
jgi:hypothetical protein